MEVILIRHTSVDVPPGTCYGQTDVPLKATFKEEAARTKAALEALLTGCDSCGGNASSDKAELATGSKTVDHVYTSPLSRCTRLAEFCGYGDAERDARLMEISFGEWEMQRFEEISDPRIQEWYADYLNVPATGGESFMILHQRVCAFLEELRQKPWRRVVIFAHGGVLLSAQVYAGLIKPEEAFDHQPPHGGIVSIELKQIDPDIY